jgi:hypothetical protein
MISWLLKIYEEGEMKLLTLSLALNGSVWSASPYGHFTFGRKDSLVCSRWESERSANACGGGERSPTPCHEVKQQLSDHFPH